MPFNVTVLGLGATGAALGLALGTIDPKTLEVGRPTITGWDTNKRAMSEARGRLMIDRAEPDLAAAVREADVVIISVPYGELREVLTRIAPVLKSGAIVTDTTPAKVPVMASATELLPITVEFVGGHPLVSASENSGAAPRDTFRNAIYCLVPLPRTRRSALDGVEALVTAIGAKPYYIDPQEHDSYVAAVAHLPLALAVALMQTVGTSGAWPELQPMAGDALIRMTELTAGATPEVIEALNGNAQALEGWLDRLIISLTDLRGRLASPDALGRVAERARHDHESLARSEAHVRPGENAFHSNIAEVDRPNLSGLFFGRRRTRGDRDKRS